MPIPQLDSIPETLRARKQWVVWRLEPREEGEKPTKVPYQAQHPQRKASSKASHTWADVRVALSTATKYGFDGIGYVFSADDPFAGIDFDDILDEHGRVALWAAPWLSELATYAEVSPSGRGIKAIVVGQLPGAGLNAGNLELYDQGRFFTITGDVIAGSTAEPQPVNGALDRLYAFAQARKEQVEHQREYDRRAAYAAAALRDECAKVQQAPEGMRNDTLNRAAFALAQFVAASLLDEGQVADALADAASIAGLGAAEIRATVRSGMSAGIQHPRQIPSRRAPANVDPDTGVIAESGWWARGITLAELQRTEFPPLRWIIQDICPEGVTLIAAKPKSKKSWIALGLALSIAMHLPALGRLEVDPGRVLYLDLEGNQRRIQQRARAILGNGRPWPDNFHVFTEWSRGDECLTRLDEWLQVYPDTRAVVIDLLAEIRPPMDPRGDRYQYDRDLLVSLNKLAERFGVAMFVIHHTRKAKGEDVFDEVSGTLGINGAVSTLWILSRAPDGHIVLSLTGRDLVKDEPLALSWDGYLCSFVIEGNAAEIAVTAERAALLELMGDDQSWTPKQLAVELGKSVNAIQCMLRDLVSAGQVDKAGYGKYARIPGQSGQSRQSRQSGQSRQSWALPEDATLSDSVSPEKGQTEFQRHSDASHANSVHSVRDSQDDDTF